HGALSSWPAARPSTPRPSSSDHDLKASEMSKVRRADWSHAAVRTRRRRGVSSAFRFALIAVAGATSGCDVAFIAPQATLLVQDGGIAFEHETDAARITGGETILTVRNQSSRKRQIVLARIADASNIPHEILAANTAEEHPRIV